MGATASSSKKYRVLVLTHEQLVPPESPSSEELEGAEWRTDYDVVKTLQKLGHEVHVQGVSTDLSVVRKSLEEWDPHVSFNLLEEFNGSALYDQNVVSYLELLQKHYTGCNPRGLMLARDKALTKKICTYHRIPTPRFAVFPKNRKPKRPKSLEFPIIVKSLTEEASAGISQASVVYDDEKFVERVEFIHEKVGTAAIGERYIEGRELYVGIMGNQRCRVLPIWEMVFKDTPEEALPIATRRVKWNEDYRDKYGITTQKAKGLSSEIESQISHLCKRIYRLLGMNGYARMDLRLTESGQVYLIEANPNPDIGMQEDFAQSAGKDGVGYDQLISQILNLGLRWDAAAAG